LHGSIAQTEPAAYDP